MSSYRCRVYSGKSGQFWQFTFNVKQFYEHRYSCWPSLGYRTPAIELLSNSQDVLSWVSCHWLMKSDVSQSFLHFGSEKFCIPIPPCWLGICDVCVLVTLLTSANLAKQEQGQSPSHWSNHDNLSTKVDCGRECGHWDLAGAQGMTLSTSEAHSPSTCLWGWFEYVTDGWLWLLRLTPMLYINPS